MQTTISAYPIHKGKVIDNTHQSITIKGVNSPSSLELREAIGLTVVQAIDKARASGWHMADPETWIRLELRNWPE